MHQRFGSGGDRPHARAVAGALGNAVATDALPPFLEESAPASPVDEQRGPPAAEQGTSSSEPDPEPEVCSGFVGDVADGAPEAAQLDADAEAAAGASSSTEVAAAGPPQDATEHAVEDVPPEGEGSDGEGGDGGTERLGTTSAHDGMVAPERLSVGAPEGTEADPFLHVLTAGESMLPLDRGQLK